MYCFDISDLYLMKPDAYLIWTNWPLSMGIQILGPLLQAIPSNMETNSICCSFTPLLLIKYAFLSENSSSQEVYIVCLVAQYEILWAPGKYLGLFKRRERLPLLVPSRTDIWGAPFCSGMVHVCVRPYLDLLSIVMNKMNELHSGTNN